MSKIRMLTFFININQLVQKLVNCLRVVDWKFLSNSLEPRTLDNFKDISLIYKLDYPLVAKGWNR